MKKHVLVLLGLLALISSAHLLAQEPAQAPVPGAATEAPEAVAPLLETRSCEPVGTPTDLPPAILLGKSCSSNSDCSSSQLCCNLCGNPPDDGSSCLSCVHPIGGRCPLVV